MKPDLCGLNTGLSKLSIYFQQIFASECRMRQGFQTTVTCGKVVFLVLISSGLTVHDRYPQGEKKFDICAACSVQSTGCIEFLCQWLEGKWAPASCGLFSSQAVTLYALASSGINCDTTISLSSSYCLCRVIEALMGVIYAYLHQTYISTCSLLVHFLGDDIGVHHCRQTVTGRVVVGGDYWMHQNLPAGPSNWRSLRAPHHHKSFLCTHPTITSSFSARAPPSQVLSLHAPHHHKSFALTAREKGNGLVFQELVINAFVISTEHSVNFINDVTRTFTPTLFPSVTITVWESLNNSLH